MAESPSHKFGQIIGNLLESVIEPFLSEFAKEKHLYLDYQKNPRKARKGKKVTWEDPYGNVHDLDYVLEMDGTDTMTGTPVAFIEVAWRRYTKHSRNKAQEIQGAIYLWPKSFSGPIHFLVLFYRAFSPKGLLSSYVHLVFTFSTSHMTPWLPPLLKKRLISPSMKQLQTQHFGDASRRSSRHLD